MTEENQKSGENSGEINQDPLLFKVKSGVAYITFTTKMAVINMETAKMFAHLLDKADKDEKVKVVVLKSTSERVFSAGFDLNMFKGGFDQQISEDVLSHGRDCSRFIYFLKKPVIAQMDGSAIGMGCIMALACDFRIVADKEGLFFQLPEINIGMTGTTGPTFNSVNILGVAHAKEMLLTGRKVSLKEMDKWGGVTQICPPEELDRTVRKFARNLATKPDILIYTQKVMTNIMGKRMAEDAYKLENEMADYWFSTEKGDIDEFFFALWEKYGTGSPKK